MSYGVRANPQQLATLQPHRVAPLATEARVHPRTAMRAKAGEPVYAFCLEALVSAAERLAARSPAHSPAPAA